ncbi:hypothetical protein DITRI_Ditri10aG0169000 [Diplodiscus trichospermus]
MERITEGVNNLNITDSSVSNNKKNRIQVSNTKKPLFFYVNLAKRYMQQYNEVELSALGMAIATVVTVAEILKNNELAVEKSNILTLSKIPFISHLMLRTQTHCNDIRASYARNYDFYH